MAKIEDVAELIMGQSPSSSTYNEVGNGLPFFQGKSDFGFRYPHPRLYCSEPLKVAKPRDILMSVRAPVGPTNVADQECCIGRGLAAIRSKTIDGDFLFFNLRYIEKYITRLGMGSTFQAINKTLLGSVEVNEPEFALAEQRKIAEILNVVQEAIEQQEQLIQKTTDLKKTLLHQLFTNGLHNEPQKQTEIGPVPESWTQKKAIEVFARVADGTHDTPAKQLEGFPLITSKALKNGKVVLSEATYMISRNDYREISRRSGVGSGDILFSMIGTVGEVAFVEEEPNYAIKNVGLFKVKDRDINRFCFHFFQGSQAKLFIHNNLSGTSQKYLSLAKLRDFPIFLPDHKEMLNIITICNTVDRKIDSSHKHLEVLKDLFRILLHQLMTAQIRVDNMNLSELVHPILEESCQS